MTKSYVVWADMIKRGYDENYKQKYPTYKDVTVCEEWHNFQNFAQWFEENYNPKTIQFTGTQDKIENLHLALGISDNDMPQQSETRVYVLDTQDISIDKGFEELTEEEISTTIDVVKIINVIKFD